MNSFFGWYMGLQTFGRMLFIIGLIVIYNLIKTGVANIINKSEKSEMIFKKLFIVRVILEVIVCLFAIWTAIMLFHVTNNLWFSLLLGSLIPTFILLNHKSDNRPSLNAQ